MKKKKYKSEALMVIHQDMEYGYKIGAISAERMRFFDEGCLVPETEPPAKADPFRPQAAMPAYARSRA